MKKILATILAAALGLGAWALTGTGTSTDPFKIATLADLQEFRDSVNASAQNIYKGKYVRLDADLDLNNGPWTPIGNSSATPFSCIFDGNGKTISNLYINDSTMNFAGFIGYTSDATIMGLKIHNANLTGNDYVGAIAGSAHATTTVQDCEVSGSIKLSGNHYVGGITGSGYAKVTGCKTLGDGAATSYIRAADAEVNAGDGDDVGGIIGLDEGGTSAIENCHVSDVTVEGFRQVGGIAGLIQNGRPVVSCTVKDVVVKCIADQNTVDKKAAKMAFGGIVGAINQSGGSVTGCTVEDVQLVSDPVGVSAARMGYVSGGYYPGTEGFLIPDSLSDKITCADNTVKNVVRATEGLQEPAVASRAIDGPSPVAQIGDVKYETLAAAVAAVPADGTATTITMIGDEAIVGNVGVTIVAGKNITLDLNGHTISQTGPMAGAGYLIKNQGTLTLKDSTDTAKNGTGTGKMTTSSENPDTGDIPSYANNLISNYGTLTIESGYYESLTNAGYASFVVDNYSGGTANITGGKLCNNAPSAYVVRMFANSTTADNTLNISGTTIIDGGYAVWLQTPNANANKASLTISGGTLNASDGAALYVGGTKADNSNISIEITDGTIGGTGVIIQGPKTGTYGHVEISGGDIYNVQCGANVEDFIYGGNFHQPVNEAYCADGYIPTAQDAETGLYSVKAGSYVAQIGDVKYETLAAAVAAVPADGTATTITMIGDEAIVGNVGVTVAAGKNITLDLNGHTISQTGPMAGTGYLIKNQGTLTLKDSTDTAKNGTGTGKMTTTSENPDTGDIPSYANNLISNYGTLTIESGNYKSLTNAGYASFVVDNYSGGTANIAGGKLSNTAEYAYVVRMFLNSTTAENALNISGGIIEGSYAVWMQYPNGNANKASLNVSGGTIIANDGYAVYAGTAGNNARDASEVTVSFTGGTVGGSGVWLGSDTAFKSLEVTGGTYASFGASAVNSGFISGGIYHEKPNEAYMADGYAGGANTDGETNVAYPTAVGLLKVSDIVQQAGATETRATYAVTVVVVNDKGETIGTLPDPLTIEVSIAAADVAGSTLAKYDVSKILDAALASAGLNVTKVEISVVISAPTSGEGTVSYEVHPEAVVTVTKDSTDTTTPIPLSNACLAADASFTFDLDVTGVVAAGDWAKVTHVSADPKYAAEARNLKAVAGDGGKVYVTVTTTHFSTFTVGAGVPPVTFGVRSDNLFGSIKIEGNVASNLYVATLFEGFEADGALRKAQDVVHATNLTAGTKMYVYDKNADKYDVFEVDANGKWAAADKLTVNVEGKATFDTADLTRGVTNGTGVIVGRKNTAETVYVYGQVPKIPIASTTFGAGQTLVSPPYTNGVECVDLNASTWTGVKATQLKRLKNQKGADYIQFRTADNRLVKYFYLEGEGWGVVPTQVSQFSEFVANGKALIPVGTAFWYYSTSGGAKVEWK